LTTTTKEVLTIDKVAVYLVLWEYSQINLDSFAKEYEGLQLASEVKTEKHQMHIR